MPYLNTAIIGGGIAGLACARQLHDAGGHDFLLFTDRLGGRMFAAAGSMCNFGATYVTSDYRHAGRYVGRGAPIRFRDIYFPDGDRLVNLFHPGNVRHGRALVRLYARLIRFRAHFNRLRAQSPFVCQADLLARDPLLRAYTREPAGEFIRRNGLTSLDDVFTDAMVHSTLFVPSAEVNTFYYLAALMPILLPTYVADFSGTLAKLTAGYEHRIVRAAVTSVERHGGGYLVRAAEEEWHARRVVIATPGHNTRRFFPELGQGQGCGVREIPIWVLHVVGQRRPAYLPGKTVFFRPGGDVTVLFPLPGTDRDLLFARSGRPDLSPYYERHQVVRCVAWKTAVQLSGAAWRRLAPEPGLYTIGDFNICGLEDSFLTGLFAANDLLRQPATQTRPYRSRPGLTGSPVR